MNVKVGEHQARKPDAKKGRSFKFPLGIRKLPNQIWCILVLLAILSCFAPDPMLGLIGVAVLAVCCVLLWRPGEPQILLFIVTYQWFQAIGGVIYAAWKGEPIATVLEGPQFELSTLLSLAGVMVLALGIKLANPKRAEINLKQLYQGIIAINQKRIFIAWAILTVGTMFLGVAGRMLPGLNQALIALVLWKWAAVLLLFLRSLLTDKNRGQLALVVLYEVSVGMMSYFSAFKFVFFVLILAGTGVIALRREKMLPLLGIGSAALVLLLIWQGIKAEYRMFLSQGQRAQVVKVDVMERISWLNSALYDIDADSFSDGMDSGLRRLGYVEYFGHAIRYVPVNQPHTNGQLWKEAVLNPLMPRALFPNKQVYDDSIRTNKYTGVRVAGATDGASISIGYMGESYIDYGKWGMFVPVLLWGLLVGWVFRWLRDKSPHPVMGLALGSCLLLSTTLLLESSNVKMTGSFAAGFLVTALILRIYGRRIWKWLLGKDWGSR